MQKERETLERTLAQQFDDRYRLQFKHHEQTLESLRQQVENFKAQELQLLTEKQRLEDLHCSLQLEVQRKLDEERMSIEEKARRQEREQASHQIKEKDQTLDSLRQQVEAHRTKELQLLKEKQALEEMSQSAELNLQRQLNEERKNIAEKARLQEREQAVLQLKQKDQTLEALREQLEVMKRKAEQGSQQAQGEIQEVALENILINLFPLDTILEVHKGINGADIVHTIYERCG